MNEIIRYFLNDKISIKNYTTHTGRFILTVLKNNSIELCLSKKNNNNFVILFFSYDFEIVIKDMNSTELFYRKDGLCPFPVDKDDIFNFNIMHDIDCSGTILREFVDSCIKLYNDELYINIQNIIP